jgi:hypothetical protein
VLPIATVAVGALRGHTRRAVVDARGRNELALAATAGPGGELESQAGHPRVGTRSGSAGRFSLARTSSRVRKPVSSPVL